MLVRELIERLNEFPPDMLVLGRGYESGYNDLDTVMSQTLYHHPNNPWYEGEFQDSDYESEGKQQIVAVTIG